MRPARGCSGGPFSIGWHTPCVRIRTLLELELAAADGGLFFWLDRAILAAPNASAYSLSKRRVSIRRHEAARPEAWQCVFSERKPL